MPLEMIWVLLMEGLRNHNFIIPRPRRKNKREMPEMQGKSLTGFPADFLPGVCRTGGDSVLVLRCERLNYVRAGLDFSRNRC